MADQTEEERFRERAWRVKWLMVQYQEALTSGDRERVAQIQQEIAALYREHFPDERAEESRGYPRSALTSSATHRATQ